MKRSLMTLCTVAISTPAMAAEKDVLAAYPVVVGCFLVVVLALFMYDISRRKHRHSLIERTRQVDSLEEEAARLTQENALLTQRVKGAETILNMLPYPVWSRGDDLKINYYNRAYRQAVEGAKATDGGVAELDRKTPPQAAKAIEQSEAMVDRRYLIIEGNRTLYDVTEMPVEGSKGTVGFATDLSEVELLKEDIERHNSAMDDFLESSASAMAIYGADMRLKSFNYAFVALWKFDEIWLNSQPTYAEILENLREKRKLPEQANFQLFKQQQTKLFRDLINPKEEFFYLPDGKALRVLAIPHALGGVMFAYEDVTDRLALERSYNTLIAVQRETLDHLHEAVAVFGEDGRLKLFNPNYAELWHLPQELMKSEPHLRDIVDKCAPLYHYDDWDEFKQNYMRQLQVREVAFQQLERKDGTVIDWRKVPLPDGATLLTYLDITDSTKLERSLRERNEALQEADKLKSQFLANVSYELRSPLTSISGFSELLSQEYFGALSEKQREYVEGIHQSSQRLMQIINDILDLASIEAGYMRLNVAQFGISAMLKSVSSLIQERAREHGLKLKVDCPARIGKMTGDETRIKQILFNLLSNAIRYSSKGDVISFGAQMQGDDGIMIWVQDDGPGIPLEEQAHIFDTFYKGRHKDAKTGKSGARSGTGLGLSIVKNFIELHGGKIELISEPGKGARFECFFAREHSKLMAA